MSWILKSNRPYIKEHQKALVKAHKYQGQELSYAYNYFYSPVCSWIADRLPLWLAPNLVSLAGFLCNLIPHLMVPLLWHSNMEGEVPSWFCALLGVGFFVYMLCDNTDGKQARRTGSSSPLGMLIDHGMDSVTAVINNMLMQSMVQTGTPLQLPNFSIGNNMIALLGLLASTLPFYYAVLEQYYTGELILGEINGIDEGSFVYIFVCFLAAYYGPVSLFNTEWEILGEQVKLAHLIAYGMIFASVFQIIPNIQNMYLKRNTEHFKKLYKKELFVSHCSWFIINAVIFTTAVWLSPQSIITTHPRRVQYAFGFQFILVSLRVQFSGVTLDKFNPFRRTSLIVWSLLLSQIFFSVVYGQSLMDEAILYLILSLISFAAIIHMVYNLINEITTILDINVLTLTKKQLDAQKVTPKSD